MNNTFGLFSTKDLEFIKTNKICPTFTINMLEKTKYSVEPYICLDHRRIQEHLRNNYNYMTEQNIWNTNNTIIHTYINSIVQFNK